MRGDGGSASVLVVGVGVLLSALAVGVGLLATGLAAHRQAVRAADLAALAGAQSSLTDAGVACRVASMVARVNGADLKECVLEGGALRVDVTVSTIEALPAVTASALAGLRSG